MKFAKTLTISSLGLALIAGAAHADDGGKGGHGKRGMHGPRLEFSEIDVNGDGQLSVTEIQGIKATLFALTDTDGNGEISAEEFAAKASDMVNPERAAKMVERFDADNSGGVSMDEMPQGRGNDADRAAKMIDKLDTDGDGQISQAEFDAGKMAHGKAAPKGTSNDTTGESSN